MPKQQSGYQNFIYGIMHIFNEKPEESISPACPRIYRIKNVKISHRKTDIPLGKNPSLRGYLFRELFNRFNKGLKGI